MTGHRRESFGGGFERICAALHTIAVQHPDCQVLFPVHLNPNVQESVNRLLQDVGNIHLVESLNYLPFVYLMTRAYLILTDSGGIQEESPSLGKPVLVMRDTTERPEAVVAGTVKSVETDVNLIVNEVSRLLIDSEHYRRMSEAHKPIRRWACMWENFGNAGIITLRGSGKAPIQAIEQLSHSE